MGGPGSTRWRGHYPKPLLEDHPALDLQHPHLQAALAHPGPVPGNITWTRNDTTLAAFSFDFSEEEAQGTRTLVLRQLQPDRESVPLQVTVVRVPMGFAPPRAFALCPTCERRCLKLHLVDGELVCRSCGGLGYRSEREHDARVDRMIRSTEALERSMQLSLTGAGYRRIAHARLVRRTMEKLLERMDRLLGANRAGAGSY